MASLDPAIQFGRKIIHAAKQPMNPNQSRIGHIATYAGLGVATGVTNNAINQGVIQHKKNQEHTAYQRGKYAGRASTK